ncbi:hypothetical protein [Pseudomonas extremaustralis]|uniref:hypothetical protein n=1 Tax=Pseudomonas extremaustralis TaxID=359110 RepID=UPI0038998B5C
MWARLKHYVQIGLDVLNVAAFFVPVLGHVMLAVTAARIVPRLQASTWADRLVPVKLPNGQARLWQADIEPYRSDIQLDAVRSPNALGQYEVDGRTYSSRHSTAPMRRQ